MVSMNRVARDAGGERELKKVNEKRVQGGSKRKHRGRSGKIGNARANQKPVAEKSSGLSPGRRVQVAGPRDREDPSKEGSNKKTL